MSEDTLPQRHGAKCGANRRGDGAGGTCELAAGWGTKHVGTGCCKLHGGNTPGQVKKAAEDQARAAALRWGEPIVTTGIDALLNLLYLWAGIEMFYRTQIQELDPSAFVWGSTQQVDDSDTGGTKSTSAAGVNTWVKLHSEASSKLADIAEQCVRAGIDERRVRLAEQQGQLLVTGLQWFIAGLGLSVAQAEIAHRLAPEMFRYLDAGAVPAIEGKVERASAPVRATAGES